MRKRGEVIRDGVDERHGGASDDRVGRLIADVIRQGLVVRGDEDGDGAVNVLGNNTLAEGKRKGEWCAAEHHLAEEALKKNKVSLSR